jgi:transcriptional regulator with XRE-family HTH domain
MAKGTIITELKAARLSRGLTMEEAGALIIIDGEPTSRGTWHAWESGRKIPKAAAVYELERVFGVEPNVYYPRPDAGEIMPPALVAQAALAF